MTMRTAESNQLAVAAITDVDSQVLLLQRREHNQWELPGGRILPDEFPLLAVARHVREATGIVPTALHRIGAEPFAQRGKLYTAELFQVTNSERLPDLRISDEYKDYGFYNLQKRGIGKITLSPYVEWLMHALQNEEIRLERH